jgi:LemA protein
MVKEAWSGIDVQLKRRADLIPNIVEAIKGYVGHEKDTLREVTEMRTKVAAVPEGDVLPAQPSPKGCCPRRWAS